MPARAFGCARAGIVFKLYVVRAAAREARDAARTAYSFRARTCTRARERIRARTYVRARTRAYTRA